MTLSIFTKTSTFLGLSDMMKSKGYALQDLVQQLSTRLREIKLPAAVMAFLLSQLADLE